MHGKKIYYPWFPGFYWTSSYSPYYIDWLKDQMKSSLEANPDYIMIDAQTSSALNAKSYGGDFSSFSLGAFKTYMGKKYSKREYIRLCQQIFQGGRAKNQILIFFFVFLNIFNQCHYTVKI